jgi:hypothetical protein
MTSTLAPSALQNARSFSTASASAPSGGVRMHQRLTNSSEKPEPGPEFSVPATGCAEWCAFRACGAYHEHLAFHRADVGDDRAGLERRRDLGRDRPLADRNAYREVRRPSRPRHWSRPVGDAGSTTRLRVASSGRCDVGAHHAYSRAARSEPPISPTPISAGRS